MYYNPVLFEEGGEAKLPAFEPGEKARTYADIKERFYTESSGRKGVSSFMPLF